MIILAYEVLRQLQETESHADEIVRKAEERAKEIIRDARVTARTLIENAKTDAATEGKSVIGAEKAKAEAEALKAAKRSSDRCDELRNAARANIPRAADLVVERIVTSSGNR